MFDAEQLRAQVIRPTLITLGLHSQAAEDLVAGTCAAESALGTYLVQVRGPALGIYQTEQATHTDLWESYLRYRSADVARLKSLVGPIWWDTEAGRPSAHALVVDLAYATAICRYHYRRVRDPLPKAGDWHAMAAYWKRHYNTPVGRGTEGHFVDACERCGVS